MICTKKITEKVDTLISEGVSTFINQPFGEATKNLIEYNKRKFDGNILFYFTEESGKNVVNYNTYVKQNHILELAKESANKGVLSFSRMSTNDMADYERAVEAMQNGEEVYVEPVGDNYNEFVNYKQTERESKEKEVFRLKNSINNLSLSDINIKDVNSKIANIEREIITIDRQLESLYENKSKLMFHAIREDLAELEQVINDKSALIDIQKANDKLTFLDEFISGKNKMFPGEPLSEYNDDSFNEITGKLKELQDKFYKKTIKFSRDTIESNEKVQKIIAEYGIDPDSLFTTQKDLNWFETWTLGVTADRTDNTVIPQVLYDTMQTTLFRKQSQIEKWNKKLTQLVKNNPELDNPEFIYEKDKDGNKTGFVLNIFTPEYYKNLRIVRNNIREFKKHMSFAHYKLLINALKFNNDVIDFSKLTIVKSIYGDKYTGYFKHSEEDMLGYEKELRDRLGTHYDTIINQLLQKLATYEDTVIAIRQKGGNNVNRDIASQNIWEFNRMVNTSDKAGKITYQSGNTVRETMFKDFDNLLFIPKTTVMKRVDNGQGLATIQDVDSGFYSQEYKNLEGDKLEYWNLIKSISEYISNTYEENTFGRLSYPKVQIEYSDRMSKLWKDKNFRGLANNLLGDYKSWFYEKGRHRDSNNNVVKNYNDNSRNEIKELANAYKLNDPTLNSDQAYDKARKEVLKGYSDNFNTNIMGIAMEAALHDARLEVKPIAEAYITYFKSIDDTRKNAINKLTHFYEKIILNANVHYRESNKTEGVTIGDNTMLGKFLSLLERIPFFKNKVTDKALSLLSDSEKKLYTELKQLEGKPSPDTVFSFIYDDVLYYKTKTGETKMKDIKDKSNKHFKTRNIFNEDFEKLYQSYITDKIEKLGLDLNLAGVINGILKTVIFKGLALNPISGIFNRIEGKHSSMIMDMTGEYWTVGNIDIANNMMNFANMTRLSDNRLSPLGKQRKDNLKIFDTLLKQFNILQDRKNELQRSAEESDFNTQLTNPFIWAVENPEYKNQGSIVLAILMDTNIKVNGEEVPFLNRETGEFTLYDITDEGIVLKPEYNTDENINDYIDMNSDVMSDAIIRMTDAVSRSQGNYNVMDIMLAKSNIWGRIATLFMTWFPEHLNQRFGISGKNNYNLSTGKKRRDGRFAEAYKANKLNTILTGVAGVTIGYGVGGVLLGAVGLGGLSFMVYKAFMNKYMGKESTTRDIKYGLELGEFLKSLLIESLNYPGRVINIKNPLIKNNKTFTNTTMSENEIAAMRAMTRELAIILTWLGVKLLAGLAMYDDDDDKESASRMRYNFVQNQLSRTINTLTIYSNPLELVSDSSRFAALQVVTSAIKVMLAIWNEKQREDLGKNLLGMTPIPKIIPKTLSGQMLWEDKFNYDTFGNMDLPSTLNWTQSIYKDNATQGEYSARKEYLKFTKNLRSKLKQKYMNDFPHNKSGLRKQINKDMQKLTGGPKKKDQSYVDKLKQVKGLN